MKKLINNLKSIFKNAQTTNIYQLNGTVPLSKAIPFGLQHVLAMFIANITPIVLIASNIGLDSTQTASIIQNAIFIAGIGTIIQLFPLWRIGGKLPIVVGISFTFLGVLSSVGIIYGYGTMIGSIIIGGLFIGIMGLFAKYWRRFISPIVAACVVLGIGLSLLPVGAKSFCGGESLLFVSNPAYAFAAWQYLVVAGITLISCIILSLVLKGIWKNLSILFGLIIGYCVALCFPGMIVFPDFSSISWITLPRLVNFGEVKFNISAILIVCLIYLVATTEGIGDVSALCATGLNREPTDKEISGALACDGFISALSGCFGCLPLTTFSQNVGIVGQTKVVNRFTILMGAIIMILAGLFPPLAAIIQTIPDAVLGGCTLMLFASIVVAGIRMIAKAGLNTRNVLIISLALGLGYGFTLVPSIITSLFPGANNFGALILENCVATIFIVSFIMNLVLPKKLEKEN